MRRAGACGALPPSPSCRCRLWLPLPPAVTARRERGATIRVLPNESPQRTAAAWRRRFPAHRAGSRGSGLRAAVTAEGSGNHKRAASSPQPRHHPHAPHTLFQFSIFNFQFRTSSPSAASFLISGKLSSEEGVMSAFSTFAICSRALSFSASELEITQSAGTIRLKSRM